MSTLEKSIDSLGKTANRIADERNKFKAQRDILLDAASAAEEWIGTVTTYDEAVPYVNGHYDGFVDLIQRKLRKAIAACGK